MDGFYVGWLAAGVAFAPSARRDHIVINEEFSPGDFGEFVRRTRDEWSDTVRPARDEAALELLRTDPDEFFRRTRRQLP